MSDFHKVEDAYRNGQLGNVLQKAPVGGRLPQVARSGAVLVQESSGNGNAARDQVTTARLVWYLRSLISPRRLSAQQFEDFPGAG